MFLHQETLYVPSNGDELGKECQVVEIYSNDKDMPILTIISLTEEIGESNIERYFRIKYMLLEVPIFSLSSIFLPNPCTSKLTKMPLGMALLSTSESTKTPEGGGLIPDQDTLAFPFFVVHFSLSVI